MNEEMKAMNIMMQDLNFLDYFRSFYIVEELDLLLTWLITFDTKIDDRPLHIITE